MSNETIQEKEVEIDLTTCNIIDQDDVSGGIATKRVVWDNDNDEPSIVDLSDEKITWDLTFTLKVPGNWTTTSFDFRYYNNGRYSSRHRGWYSPWDYPKTLPRCWDRPGDHFRGIGKQFQWDERNKDGLDHIIIRDWNTNRHRDGRQLITEIEYVIQFDLSVDGADASTVVIDPTIKNW